MTDCEPRGASHNEPAPLSLFVLTTAGGLLRPSPSHLVSLSREQLSGAALITEAVPHSPRLGLQLPAPAASMRVTEIGFPRRLAENDWHVSAEPVSLSLICLSFESSDRNTLEHILRLELFS